ncbi:MAG TPA: GNAT family N-acetyltransferase [Thermomicrobiales bacterium]|nr:GNAT family N-acetyltransferase [Thermomicrobiales bacterium]
MTQIRAARASDYDLVLPLFLGLREFSRAGHPPQADDFGSVLAASREYLREVLARGPECTTLLALAEDGRLAGYVVVSIHEPNPLTSSGAVRSGSIDELFLDTTSRGQGVGRLLVSAACDWLAELRAERVEVGAYAWNAAAIAFYKREGFAPQTITFTKDI